MVDKKFLLAQMLLIKKLFAAQKTMDLRELANSVMKKAALENDVVLAHIAVLAYALHKILTKEHVTKSGFWLEYEMSLTESIEKAINALKAGEGDNFEKALNSVGVNLEKIDAELGRYVQSTYTKGKVKYAADAYYYGVSLSQAAALTGASKDELQSYIGVTKQHDLLKDKKGIKLRLDEFKKSMGLIA